jgi:hypothetical protein
MSVIRVGSSSGYAAGWENIFGGAKKSRQAAGKAVKAKTSAKPVSVKAAKKDKKTSARKKR